MNTTLIASVQDSLQSLNRIVSLLRGRNFAIDSLTLARSERPGVARLTLSVKAPSRAQRVMSCLDKLEEVLTIAEASAADVVRREAALLKFRNSEAVDAWVSGLSSTGPARAAERGAETTIVDLFGEPEAVEAAIASAPSDALVECARLGQFAIAR
jgi:acetolactate synthase-1/3 small subunit